jgi:hypothetical protein
MALDKKNRCELIPPTDANLQARFDQGHEFEKYVEPLFSPLVCLGFDGFSAYQALPNKTLTAWVKGASIVAQGRYVHAQATCIVDLLSKQENGHYKLIEIKSSTSQKPEHIFDLAFQKVVLDGAGFHIDKCELAIVNKEYVRKGEVEPEKLVNFIDVTDKVFSKVEDTKIRIRDALTTINSSQMPDPKPEDARLGSYSEWMKIREQIEPPMDDKSIHNLPYMSADKASKLIKEGVTNISDISDYSVLGKATQKYLRAKDTGSRFVDTKRLKQFIHKIQYPLHFFDYETSQNLVPVWNDTKPYQQVTFQYSLHVQKEPSGKLEHYEYLHRDVSNPIPRLLDRLSQHIQPTGSVLVWYESFEKSRNSEMAAVYENHKQFLDNLNSRIIDLMIPFSEEMVIDPRFKGSASIKAVLPVFNSNLSYKDLNIQEGGSAARLWKQVVFGSESPLIQRQTFDDLVKYCERDTFAMVEIYDQLRQAVDDKA